MLLTKRPGRLAEFAEWYAATVDGWPVNLICGTSLTTQRTASRLSDLAKVLGRRFVSVEPLWERIDLGDLSGIDLVIAGGQSGGGARPCRVEWIRAIRDQCRAANVACFIKQLGANPIDGDGSRLRLRDGHGGDSSEWPEDLRIRQLPAVSSGMAGITPPKRTP
jgi:protein gp37